MADTISMDLDDLDDVVEVPLEDPVLDPVEQGEIQKKLGNERYLSQDYRGALVCYNKAIDWCPANAAYYGNRAACLIMMKDFFGALIDSKKAVTLNPTYFKGYNRIAKCAVAVGDLSTAETAIQRGLELEPGNSTFDNEKQSIETLRRHMEDARKSEAQGDFRRVLYCMDRCLEIAVSCVNFKLVKAESLVKLGRMLEGEELANEVLLRDRNNVEAIYVRGLSLYYQDSMDKALQHFQAVLRLAPDLQKAKDAYKRCKLLTQTKEEGNTIYNEGRLAEALEAYNRALQIDPLNKATNAKIYFNRATVYVKLNRLQETIADCTKALELQPEYQKPLLRRAKTYIALEMYQEAVADYETAYSMDKSREIKRMLNDAKMALKRSKRKDYYKILGVNRDASEDEIKKAYKRRALEHHPDRHSHASEAEKKEQEVKFKEVGEAYGVLLDPKKRARYDNGQDLDDDFDGHGHGFSTMDATNLFNAFYGGGVPRDGFTFQSPGSFPAGFSFHFN